MSVELIDEFTKRSQLTPAELGAAARPMLENLEIQWLAPLLTNKYPQPQGQYAAAQYTEVFRQRLAGALRDAQIGFSGGRDVAAEPERTIQANAFKLLEAIEESTRGSSTPVLITGELPHLGMTEEEAKAAYNYLRGKGLIRTNFTLAFAALLSPSGHDALRDAQRAPDQTSPAFPEITYNYLHVETMIGSNVQQGVTNSKITGTQTITTGQLMENVRNLITKVRTSFANIRFSDRDTGGNASGLG